MAGTNAAILGRVPGIPRAVIPSAATCFVGLSIRHVRSLKHHCRFPVSHCRWLNKYASLALLLCGCFVSPFAAHHGQQLIAQIEALRLTHGVYLRLLPLESFD